MTDKSDGPERVASVSSLDGATSGRRRNILRAGAIGAFACLILAGPGYRASLWGLELAFAIFVTAAGLGLVTCLSWTVWALLAKRRHRSKMADPMSSPGLVTLAALSTLIPLSFLYAASHYPRIHDITTDTIDPPQFVTLVAERGAESNSIAYDDQTVAERQRTSYPDLQSLTISNGGTGDTGDGGPSPESVFDQARYTLEAMGLDIVDANRSEGRIEATATSFWFGFKDDLVVRLRPVSGSDSAQTLVDVRSVSRVGQSDLGANAKRIRKFLFRMRTYKIS